MAEMICPKCGFKQDPAEECGRCGIIIARFRPAIPSSEIVRREDPGSSSPPKPGIFRRIYRVSRWVSLTMLVLVLALILWPAAPPPVRCTPEAAQRATSKVRDFQASARLGRPEPLKFDQEELNGWIRSNLALKEDPSNIAGRPAISIDGSAIKFNGKPLGGGAAPDQDVAQVQSSVRDVKIELSGEALHAYVLFELYGKDMSLELEGRVVVEDGHLRLEPTAGKLGSLPLAGGTLRSAARRIFDSPENRDKFALPPEIRDIRVQDGQLVVSPRY